MSTEPNSAVRLYWNFDTCLTVQSCTEGNVHVKHVVQNGILAYDRHSMRR